MPGDPVPALAPIRSVSLGRGRDPCTPAQWCLEGSLHLRLRVEPGRDMDRRAVQGRAHVQMWIAGACLQTNIGLGQQIVRRKSLTACLPLLPGPRVCLCRMLIAAAAISTSTKAAAMINAAR